MYQYLLETFSLWDLDPLHVTIEAICLAIIVYLWFQKSYKIRERPEALTEREIDTLIEEWEPEPLVPRLSEQQKWNDEKQKVLLQSAPSVEVVLADGRQASNFASSNFLGMADHESTKEAAIEALRTYGCGSCGPRGFYGTMDKHLECEARLAAFMKTEEAIIYSSGFATVASSIPAFSKVFDLIICDAGVIHSIQTGVGLSRSKVVYFRHNDMADLKRILEQTRKDDVDQRKKPYRTFVVIEGLYQNSDIAPLKEIVALKNEYFFRIIMDDSMGVGTLGKTGRGTCEYWDVPTTAIDVLTSSMSHALGSIGGFCAGARTVVFHQRLNASGYVFSASSPPYLVASATQALNIIHESDGKLQKVLREKIKFFHNELKSIEEIGLKIRGACRDSPIIHFEIRKEVLDAKLNKELASENASDGRAKLERRFARKEDIKARRRLREEQLLQHIVDAALQEGVLFLRPSYVEMEKFMPEPSIRATITTTQTEQHISKAASVLKECARAILEQ